MTKQNNKEGLVERTHRASQRPYRFSDDYESAREQDAASKEAIRQALQTTRDNTLQEVEEWLTQHSPTCGGGKCYIVQNLLSKLKEMRNQ